MPCYNSEEYVRGALDSLENQTYPHWELVLINDGSKDGTLNILEEYAQQDARIKVHSKENGGYVSAINAGLEHITGDYFLMMGSDDALAGDLFESLANNIEDELPDVIAFQTLKIKNGENIGLDKATRFDTRCVEFNTTFTEFSRNFPIHSEILFVRDTSKCFKRAKLGELRYFGKYGIDSDGAFSMLFCRKAHSFLAVPVVGYFWTLREDSVSANFSLLSTEKHFDRICVWNAFFNDILGETQVSDKEKRYLVYFLNIVYIVLARGEKLIKNYRLIKSATKTIQKAMKKFQYREINPIRFFLVRHFPLTFSKVVCLKNRIRRK